MFFSFKRSVIHLDCFTHRPDVYEYTPIVKGTQCMPDWWKKLEKPKFDFETLKNFQTMKSCAGFIDFFANSVSIRLWCDLAIKLNKNKTLSYNFSDSETPMHSHVPSEYGNYINSDYQQCKIISPWLFSCKKDINWVWVGNQWNENLNNDTTVLSGISNFKKQFGTNIQMIVKYNKYNEVHNFYKQGTPFVNIFPMSEKKVKIHNHLISVDEQLQMSYKSSSIKFFNKYFRMNQIKAEQEKSKCPFHF